MRRRGAVLVSLKRVCIGILLAVAIYLCKEDMSLLHSADLADFTDVVMVGEDICKVSKAIRHWKDTYNLDFAGGQSVAYSAVSVLYVDRLIIQKSQVPAE